MRRAGSPWIPMRPCAARRLRNSGMRGSGSRRSSQGRTRGPDGGSLGPRGQCEQLRVDHWKWHIKRRRGGKGRPYREEIDGDDLQRSTGRWMRLTRAIDRSVDWLQREGSSSDHGRGGAPLRGAAERPSRPWVRRETVARALSDLTESIWDSQPMVVVIQDMGWMKEAGDG
jgi:hypothetical protein